MSIHGISGPFTPQVRPQSHASTSATRHQPAPTPASVNAARTLAGPERAGSSPVPAPPGTDAALWSVLSEEERSFFAKVGAMGPLTYGRVLSGQMSPPSASLRGGRLDFKV